MTAKTVQRRYYSFDREGRLVLVRQETELYGQPSDSLSPEPYPGPAEAAEAFRQVMAGRRSFPLCIRRQRVLPLSNQRADLE